MSDTAERKTPEAAARGSFARRWRRLVRYVLVFVTVILVIDAIVGDKGLLTLLKARRDFDAVEAALAAARSENTRLRDEARRLREDPSAIEEAARRDLGLIRPGEKVFIIREAPKK